jgi:hypothetical protein
VEHAAGLSCPPILTSPCFNFCQNVPLLLQGEGQEGEVKLGGNDKSQVDFDGKNALFLRQESLIVKLRMRYSRDKKALL